MCVFSQPPPHLREGEQALRPWVQQQRVIGAVLTLGEANGQPVNGAELDFNGFVQPGVPPGTPVRHLRLVAWRVSASVFEFAEAVRLLGRTAWGPPARPPSRSGSLLRRPRGIRPPQAPCSSSDRSPCD